MMPISDPKTGALFTGLIVTPSNFVFINKEGHRFVNEFESRDVLSKAALEQKISSILLQTQILKR